MRLDRDIKVMNHKCRLNVQLEQTPKLQWSLNGIAELLPYLP